MSATLQGRLITSPFSDTGALVGSWPERGDYYRDALRGWCCVTPLGQDCALHAHQVTEHEDGTITVAPSILVRGGGAPREWHGYLERGVWREC